MKSFRLIIIFAIFTAIYLFYNFLDLITDYLWFDSLGLLSVFELRLKYQIFIWIGVFVAFTSILYLNFTLTLRLTRFVPTAYFRLPGSEAGNLSGIVYLTHKILKWIAFASSAFLGYISASFAKDNWELILRYINQKSFGVVDPVFSQDIGFYFFSYPFWNSILGWLEGLVVLCLITCLSFYFLRMGLNAFSSHLRGLFHGPIKIQISFLLAALTFLIAFEFYLDRYSLLWSSTGVVYGAGFTDLHTRLYSYWFMSIFTIALGGFVIYSFFLKGAKLLALIAAVFLATSLLTQGIIPGVFQKFIVEPNELVKETPYIKNNIEYTRLAYDLNEIDVREYGGTAELDNNKINANLSTIHNIRLWDWEPLLSTYRQLQEIRLYYRFNDVDVDRYIVDGEYRQMMMSIREFEYRQVPERAQTWVNQRLRYTHGYGLVASPVNQVTEEGLPDLFIKDIPPNQLSGMEITRPEIYYGELTRDYIFTNTESKEFDYPIGDKNQDSVYQGDGGILMNSFIKRMIYALAFQNFRIQISNYFNDESRVHYHRNILERVKKIAPFLRYDRDPYPVIADGRIYWIIDAYVLETNFPYSEPFDRSGFNYIRNPIKVVIDAYNGKVQFVNVEPNEPVIETYNAIFPDLFTDIDSVPESIRNHFRYPVDLFKVQAQMYLAYHMIEPTVFYNREDMWRFPTEKVAGIEKPVDPYYMIMKLPEEKKEEFLLILPFTPVNKSNMVAWMATGNDKEKYGKTRVYKFPKQELIYGPMQIESRIDQNPIISEQITLWSQQGSEVIRGNLLVIPIENSLLYVEPLYLRAKTGQMPELKRVILAYKNDIVMENTIEAGLRTIFRGIRLDSTSQSSTPSTSTTLESSNEKIRKLGILADEVLRKSETAIKSGDWKSYGEYQEELKQVIQELNRAITASNK
ncbi:UPF0182 family membrane protein [Leptospira sp. GIMC2001]|uniref:UPF0182 family membrane protein n=1 Tax=Leptospira sp. GIMC2001 TaxID=1513297 RepID=UPI00234A4730|nr:UPF0182 family protein [Leptospira sp. GIMC2001]WCL48821.1 UPF0182 family protein [Leptospira sp. GIMC2001]